MANLMVKTTTTTVVVEKYDVGGTKRSKKDGDDDDKEPIKKILRVSAPATFVQCQAVTHKGVQCGRMAARGSCFCWQHKDEMDDEGEAGPSDDKKKKEPRTPEPKFRDDGHTGLTQEMLNL